MPSNSNSVNCAWRLHFCYFFNTSSKALMTTLRPCFMHHHFNSQNQFSRILQATSYITSSSLNLLHRFPLPQFSVYPIALFTITTREGKKQSEGTGKEKITPHFGSKNKRKYRTVYLHSFIFTIPYTTVHRIESDRSTPAHPAVIQTTNKKETQRKVVTPLLQIKMNLRFHLLFLFAGQSNNSFLSPSVSSRIR